MNDIYININIINTCSYISTLNTTMLVLSYTYLLVTGDFRYLFTPVPVGIWEAFVDPKQTCDVRRHPEEYITSILRQFEDKWG